MKNLDDLYMWFDENRDTIIADHEKELALVKDNAVVGYFRDDNEALKFAKQSGFSMGEFLVQECVPKDEECMYYYNGAVTFG